MANYYTKLSTMVRGTPEELAGLQAVLAGEERYLAEESDYDLDHGCVVKLTDEGLWIHGDEGAAPDVLGAMLTYWMKTRGIDMPLHFEFANDCSKARIDGYGGGACFIEALGARAHYLSTSYWILERLSEAAGKKA